jgi:hypothetical protein
LWWLDYIFFFLINKIFINKRGYYKPELYIPFHSNRNDRKISYQNEKPPCSTLKKISTHFDEFRSFQPILANFDRYGHFGRFTFWGKLSLLQRSSSPPAPPHLRPARLQFLSTSSPSSSSSFSSLLSRFFFFFFFFFVFFAEALSDSLPFLFYVFFFPFFFGLSALHVFYFLFSTCDLMPQLTRFD